MDDLCAECGRIIEEQPATGRRRKYCHRCSPPDRRQRASRGRAPVVQLPVRDPGEPTLVGLTRKALDDAGVGGTWKAEAAIAVARLIDNEKYGASGAASNVRAHREAVQFALADSSAELDAIDLIFLDDHR
jgi:hypothetical protein